MVIIRSQRNREKAIATGLLVGCFMPQFGVTYWLLYVSVCFAVQQNALKNCNVVFTENSRIFLHFLC